MSGGPYGPEGKPPPLLPQNLTKLIILVFLCQLFGAGTLSFMPGGPYGPRGVLSDFGGGRSPKCVIGQTQCILESVLESVFWRVYWRMYWKVYWRVYWRVYRRVY